MEPYNFSPENILNVLLNLSSREIIVLCDNSKYGYELRNDELLWEELFNDKFKLKLKIHNDQTWYENYIYVNNMFSIEQLSILKLIKHCSSLQQILEIVYRNSDKSIHHVVLGLYKTMFIRSETTKDTLDNAGYLFVGTIDSSLNFIPLNDVKMRIKKKDLENLKITGSLITHDHEATYYCVYLSIHQLQQLPYIYTSIKY